MYTGPSAKGIYPVFISAVDVTVGLFFAVVTYEYSS